MNALTRYRSSRRARRRRRRTRPPLRLTPYAWAKLLCLRDLGETEVGGFGVSSQDDLLLLEDVQLVRQECTPVTVKFDDSSVADHFDDQVDQGRMPEEFARIWIHTHPGESPYPSRTDEETFARCFGKSDWAVMFILARGGETYARLRFNTGPGSELILPAAIDYRQPFAGTDVPAWKAEYNQMVSVEPREPPQKHPASPFPDMTAWPDGFDRMFGDLWPEGLAAEIPMELLHERFD